MRTKMLLLASALLLASCGASNPETPSTGNQPGESSSLVPSEHSEATLTGIELTNAPDKTAYKEGETFDPEGMVISAVYSDSSKKAITDYAIENKALTKGVDSILVSYQGFSVSVPISVRYTLLVVHAGENSLNLYSDHTTVFMEGTDYETIIPFEILSSGDIKFNVPSQIAGMLSMSFARKGGKALIYVHQSYGGDAVYEASLIEYNEAFDLTRSAVYQETVETSSLVIYDTLEAVLTLDGVAKEGKVTYEEGESKNAFAFVDKDGNKTEATTGAYDNIFTLAEVFVLTDSLVRDIFGYTIAHFENDVIGLYFYADGGLGIVLKDTPVTELPYNYNTWKYDNSDLLNPKLTLGSAIPAAYGGPSFVAEYDADEDVMTITVSRGGNDYAIAIDGTQLDKALGDYVEVAVLYTLTATEAKRGNDVIDASNFALLITEKAVELSLYSSYTQSYNTLATGAWQFSQENGFGFALTGEYVKNGFAHGGFNGTDQLSVTIELTIQSASEVTFTLTAEEYPAFAAALA